MKKNNKFSRILMVVLAIAITIMLPFSTLATKVKVTANVDDIYNQLKEAARINVLMNTLIKCLPSSRDIIIPGDKTIKSGDIFEDHTINWDGNQTDISTALWVEDKVQGNGSDDGAIWCYQSGGGNGTILAITAYYMDLKPVDLMCDGGAPGVYNKLTDSGMGVNCDEDEQFGLYIKHVESGLTKKETGLKYLRKAYEKWRNGYIETNPYIPTWDMIGKFDNVDGYFNYLLDFNTRCSTTSTSPVLAADKQPNKSYYPITQYTLQNEGAKLIEQRQWYILTANKSWSYGLSADNPQKSCGSLLNRIEYLRVASNGIQDSRGGYEDIMKEEHRKACQNATTGENRNAWEELRDKFQEVVDDPEAPDDIVEDAKANVEKINNILTNGNYSEESGDIDSEEGKVYQCTEIEGLTFILENYHYKGEDLDNDDIKSEVNCYTAGGSLGWILCPLLEAMTNAANTIYDSVVEPYLVMDTVLLDTDAGPGEATYNGWKHFQTIANIGLVLLLIIVVFSQLTGIGIDNYGIKKILPKLIVSAVLINLSFIICQLSVDVSNITGSSIKKLFDSLAGEAKISTITYGAESYAVNTGAIATTLSAVGILALLVFGIVAIFSNGFAILIPLLIGALSAIISIFFVFLLLSLRKAAVIVLVVISPLAFAAYMLPNTKKLFDRWLKALEGMLILYPIAGALIGGGNFVSRLLLSTGQGNHDFFFALSAMIIGIAPIFFIPSLLKHSFAAIGNIGAKISGFSKGTRHRATGWARHKLDHSSLTHRRDFNRVRKEQTEHERRNSYNANRARRTLSKLSGKNIAEMSDTERSRYLTSQRMVNSADNDAQDAYNQRFHTMNESGISEQVESMTKTGKMDKNLMASAINSQGQKDQGAMLDMLQKASTTEAWKNMSDDDRTAIAHTLMSQKGNAVAQSMGKVMLSNGNVSLSDAMSGRNISGKSIGDHIRGGSVTTLAEQDKDVLKWLAQNDTKNDSGESMVNTYFTDDQVRTALSQSDGTSEAANAMGQVLSKRENLDRAIDGMTEEQISGVRQETVMSATRGRSREDIERIHKAASERARKAAQNKNVSARLDHRLIRGQPNSK